MKSQKGYSFIEIAIALAILGVISIAFLGGLTTASRGLMTTDERQTAKNLVEAQMEYVKNQSYKTSYSKSTDILAEYDGYDVTITTTSLEDDGMLQRITITASHGGDDVFTLENYKVMRVTSEDAG